MDIQAVLLKREQLRRDLDYLRSSTVSYRSFATLAKLVKLAWIGRLLIKRFFPATKPLSRLALGMVGLKLFTRLTPLRWVSLFFKA